MAWPLIFGVTLCLLGCASGPAPVAGPAEAPSAAVDAEPPADAGDAAEAAGEAGPAPLRLDRDVLAGLALTEWPDMEAEDVLSGGAGHRGHVFFSGDELVVELWEADAAKLRLDDFPYEEFVLVLSGKLVLTDAAGNATAYTAGDSLVVPKGFTGTWEMFGNYRELVVIEKKAYVRAEGE